MKKNLLRVAIHDPCVIKDKDENGASLYYIFGTHIEAAKSRDLQNWYLFTNGYTRVGNALYGDLSANLAEPFKWAGENDSDSKGGFAVWAPDVFYDSQFQNEDGTLGAYLIYFCTSSTYCRSAIAYASSKNIEGPYTYCKTLVYSGFTATSAKDKNSDKDKIWTNTNIAELMAEGRIDEGFDNLWARGSNYNTDYAPNAIDPGIFADTEGKMWMTYGSWSGGIYILELDPRTGDAIYPKTTTVTPDGRVVDKYFGTRIAAGHTLSSEGPFIIYDEQTKYYYLYTTYDYLDAKSGYNMRLFRSKTPTGPYLDAQGQSAIFEKRSTNQYEIGIKVMGNYTFSCLQDGYRSPGHCSTFKDDDGQLYLIYHTRFNIGGDNFQTRVHQQFMSQAAWPVTAVFENRGDKINPKGYSTSSIAGTYEFINHGIASDNAGVKIPETIVLKKDGTVTGDAEGTWVQEKGSYYATFVLDGETYNGVFFEQHDESAEPKLVMTFTAIGENNMTIWGVKQK